ncbi:ankyrin repeat domain-containing protein [Prosthecobacter sp.]|uniref:ankyrin repeat domain-containing protein n=1 Tax=Prosthecobacter sp. TaxID=1965333 RepID=UPI0037847F3B
MITRSPSLKQAAWTAICLMGLGAAFSQVPAGLVKREAQAGKTDDPTAALIALVSAPEADSEACQALLLKGANPNAHDSFRGQSVLMVAVLGARTLKGRAGPLDEEKSAARLEVARILLDAGADPNKARSEGLLAGFTPLMAAAAGDLSKAVELLLRYKADVNAQSSEGMTALCYAARDNNVPILKLLANAGGDVNGGKDFKPLHLAARCGSRQAAAFLLDSKADVNAKNAAQRTPLGEAQDLLRAKLNDPNSDSDEIKRLQEVISLLREHGGKE